MQKMAGKRVFGETIHEKETFARSNRKAKKRTLWITERWKDGETMAATEEKKRADEIKK